MTILTIQSAKAYTLGHLASIGLTAPTIQSIRTTYKHTGFLRLRREIETVEVFFRFYSDPDYGNGVYSMVVWVNDNGQLYGEW